MLDRSERGDARRRGTDLVRVQQVRAVSRNGRQPSGRKQAPAIYLSELGPRRVMTQLKWFVSTIIVAVCGLAVIGIVIYTSMHIEDGSGMLGAMRRASLEAMKPKASGTLASEKPVAVAFKSDRLEVSSKGLTTKNTIYEQVTQRRGTRDFITTKPYVRLIATLATERPDDNVPVPAFNALDLFGNDTPVARKEQAGGELTSDPRVSVRFIDIAGGFLPREDGQELSNDEVERLVAEADAVYAESEAGLADVEADTKPADGTVATAAKPEKNTTVLYKKSEEEDVADAFDIRTITARGGETIDSLVKGAGVDIIQAGKVAEAAAKITKSRKLRAGEELRLALAPSSVEEGALDIAKLSVFYQSNHLATVAKNLDGVFEPSNVPVKADTSNEESGSDRATVYVSVFRAAETQDLPQDFIFKFLKIHTYDVDYKAKVRPGDGFDLFYDLLPDDNGGEKPGELLYAGITIGGESKGYYRFRTPDGSVDYYDDKGSNSKKFLMRMPVKSARLTSGFGWRKHPLLHTLKLHSGVDWAGPIGTPIMAAGSGTIEVAGREGGYGNYIRIRHANGYKTAYGHMLRFAEGITKGAKVQQGQIIGYIGNTGFSTGPHVHYEVLVNNRFMNPLSIKIPRSRQLQGRLLTEFRREKSRIDELMHRAPVKTRVAAVEK